MPCAADHAQIIVRESFMTKEKFCPVRKILFFAAAGLACVLAAGVIIPRLTVHDEVAVDPGFREKVMRAAVFYYQHPWERIAYKLGKSCIVSAGPQEAEVESFTMFRVPMQYLQGSGSDHFHVTFTPAGEENGMGR